MFRITRKADYAVFILSYLARRTAEDGQDALVSAQELASFSALNKSLVANLLKDLTRAGFLASVRGARGGYRLARTAKEISLGQILRAVEGPFTFVECAHERGVAADRDTTIRTDATGPTAAPGTDGFAPFPDHDHCNLAGMCQSKGPLLVLHFRIQRMLDELKLAELCGVDLTPNQIPGLTADMFPSRSSLQRPAGSPTDSPRLPIEPRR